MTTETRELFEAWFKGAILPASPCHGYYTKEALEWCFARQQAIIDKQATELSDVLRKLDIARDAMQNVVDDAPKQYVSTEHPLHESYMTARYLEDALSRTTTKEQGNG